MKALLVVALLCLASASDWNLFNDFLIKYEKRYDSLEELNTRFVIFKTNLVRIAEHNAENIRLGGEAVHGINGLADLSIEEFRRTRVMKSLSYRAPAAVDHSLNVTFPATTVDWRTKGVITPVKDQGNCGSCWAHSADEAVESFYAIKSGNLQVLSVQQCTACTYAYNGCDGGWPHDVYPQGIEARNGLELNSAYPYNIAQAGNCQLTNGKAVNAVTDDSGYSSPLKGQLQTLLTNTGPVSVCVSAETWQTYTGGVMMTCGTGSVDHCVQAVGYNSDASTPYWLVRNSWGTSWGIQGYIYLSMTADGGDICHIQEYMTYPTISAVP
jgi:Pyruvate/2-oxoacid:ferredoxin oxidoreductase delta subunit